MQEKEADYLNLLYNKYNIIITKHTATRMGIIISKFPAIDSKLAPNKYPRDNRIAHHIPAPRPVNIEN